MSELKFICPACNQHISCEKAYVGHKLPCPTCGAELRVPFSNSPGGAPNALPRAELIIDPAAVKKPAELATAQKVSSSDIPMRVEINAHPHATKPPPAATPA